MKSILKRFVFFLGSASGFFALGRWRTRSSLRIFTYHGVERCDDAVLNFDKLQIDPDLFEKHIAWISSRYRVISGAELLNAIESGGQWPDRAALVTFDDGYANNLEIAAPILKRYKVPAIVFVSTGFIEGTEKPWWYQLRAQASNRLEEVMYLESELVKKERREQLDAINSDASAEQAFAFLTIHQLGELSAYNIDVGLHGHAHLACGVEDPGLIKNDLEVCKDKLKEWGIETLGVFAYPYGSLPSEPTNLGISAGVTTQMGTNPRGGNPLLLRRFDVNGGRSVANLAAITSGWW